MTVNKKNVYYFKKLSQLKEQRIRTFPQWTVGWAEKFVSDFQKVFIKRWKFAKTI